MHIGSTDTAYNNPLPNPLPWGVQNPIPKDKFAQYTTAYDAIQIFFWDIMLHPETPALWGTGLGNIGFISAWNDEMNAITGDPIGSLRDSLPENFRSYIGPGCNHTIFTLDDDFYGSSLTSSAGPAITFREWLTAMTGEKMPIRRNGKILIVRRGSTAEKKI